MEVQDTPFLKPSGLGHLFHKNKMKPASLKFPYSLCSAFVVSTILINFKGNLYLIVGFFETVTMLVCIVL